VSPDPSTRPFFLAVGDPLIALTPSRPVALEDADELEVFTGGAEINTAIGVRRLGVGSAWLGRVGDDPLGRRVLRSLREESVDTSLVVVDPTAPTGLYLREWLPDGVRRPYYYRDGGAGARLSPADWPVPWPAELPTPSVLHVTGITTALSSSAVDAIHTMIERVHDVGCAVSVDPNHRAVLWPDAVVARRTLLELVERADILLFSEDDAHVLFGTIEPAAVFAALRPFELQQAVFKRGARGAIVCADGEQVEIAAEPASAAIDPVGAGDGFNAGFLAAAMRGAEPVQAARCGAWCGARAVERLGESSGYPTRAQMPDPLRQLFDAAESRGGHTRQGG
jgi:2-dehydro-3-deoxygluconokinase